MSDSMAVSNTIQIQISKPCKEFFNLFYVYHLFRIPCLIAYKLHIAMMHSLLLLLFHHCLPV
ncbi:hypothetical protein Hanom_Chr09g00871721 [Helianthus anomalus]